MSHLYIKTLLLKREALSSFFYISQAEYDYASQILYLSAFRVLLNLASKSLH